MPGLPRTDCKRGLCRPALNGFTAPGMPVTEATGQPTGRRRSICIFSS